MKAANRSMSHEQQSGRDRGDDLPTVKQLGGDLISYLRDYARENPEAAALWCLGIGFVLGWKLKPW